VSTVSADLATWLTTRREEVEAALERYLHGADVDAPATLEDAMRYSVMAGGKRLRPMLVLASAEATAEAQGADAADARRLALPAACAVELIHTYSLVHDDLPAMDNDTLRRGRPTSHVVFGEGMAILCGDALLSEAFALLAREPRTAPGIDARELAARKLKAIGAIARAAGAGGMVGGQAIDLLAAGPGAAPLDLDALRGMHSRKTGALITGSAVAGALLAGASDTGIAAIRGYAESLGLAFQIVDDILDVEGVSAELGKTAGKDAAAGKPTYPAFYGVERSRRLAAESVDRAIASLETARVGGQLPAIARWVISRTH
jgi:geranylgeranyl diphosphate synthase type II